MKHIILTLIILCLAVNASAGHSAKKEVLFIHSYHQGFKWDEDLLRGIKKAFGDDGRSILLHNEYLDTKMFPPQNLDSLAERLKSKYAQHPFDLVVLADDNAFNLVTDKREKLFPDTPIVFCGVNNLTPERLNGLRNMTGVNEYQDIAGAIKTIRRLQPRAKRLHIILDDTTTSRKLQKQFSAIETEWNGDLSFDYLQSMDIEAISKTVSGYGPTDALLHVLYFQSPTGETYDYDELVEILGKESPVPVFGLWDFYLDHGSIGGLLTSGYWQGEKAGELALRILRGEPADKIPVVFESPNRHMFDARQLRRFGISRDSLPAGSQVLFEPYSFFRANRGLVLATVGFVCILLLVISLLSLNIRRRLLAEARLSENEQKLRGLFDQTFELMGLLSPDGILLDANRTSLEYIGIEREAVIGKPFWETPWWTHQPEVQRQIQDGVKEAARGETVRFETSHPAADGSVRAFDFSLRPLRDQQGEIIYLIPEGRDISERKEMEQALQRSEERLATAMRAANKGLWDWRIDIDETFFNPTYYTMLGYEPGEFPPSVSEFILRIHEEDREQVKSEIDAHLDGRTEQYRCEFRFLHKEGAYRWIEALGEVVNYRPDGTPLRMIGIHSDITERKENEYQLYKAQNYIRNILDSMPSMIISVDPDGRITQWNMEAEKTTGTSAADARGKLLSEVIPRLGNQMEQVKVALLDRQPKRQTKIAALEEHSAHYDDITVYPLVANGVDGAVIRVDDITERVRLEEMMIQSEKMLSVGGLAAGMAHEINNPLAGILQASQVLLNRLRSDLPKGRKVADELGLDPALVQQYLEQLNFERMLDSIHESGRRAAKIVENILNFSRKSDASMPKQSLQRLVDNTLELAANDFDLKSRYDFRKIEIARNFAPDLPDVACDTTQIQQVLLNLLKNGAQAIWSTDLDRPPKITINLHQQGPNAVIEVADNGPGMDAELSKRIFEPFFTTKEVGEGTGLGLSVSYFIVTEHHRGSMEVKSSPGTGTCFTIRLPLEQHQEDYA